MTIIFAIMFSYSISINLKSEKSLTGQDCDFEAPAPAIVPAPIVLQQIKPVFTQFRSGYIPENAEGNTIAINKYNALSNSDFIKAVYNTPQNAGYCTKQDINLINESNQNVCASKVNTNLAIAFLFKICSKAGDVIKVRTYNDYTTGGLFIYNGVTVSRIKSFIWWALNINNISFSHQFTAKTARVHTYEIAGFEFCCDGVNKVQLSYNGKPFEDYDIKKVSSYCDEAEVFVDDNVTPSLDVFTPVFSQFRSGYIPENAEGNTVAINKYNALSNSDFIKAVYNTPQNAGYCTKQDINLISTNNKNTCSSGIITNLANAFIFKFCAKKGDSIKVRTYNDYTTGGLFIVNGVTVSRIKTFIWWALDINRISFSYDTTAATAGVYKAEMVGFEFCCDGVNKVQLSYNGKPFEDYEVNKVRSYCDEAEVFVDDNIAPSLNVQ